MLSRLRLVALLCLFLAFSTGARCNRRPAAPAPVQDASLGFPEELETIPGDASQSDTSGTPTAAGLQSLIDNYRAAQGLPALNTKTSVPDQLTTVLNNYSKLLATNNRTGKLPHDDDSVLRNSRQRVESVGIVPEKWGLSEVLQIAKSEQDAFNLLMNPGYKSIIGGVKWTNLAIGLAKGTNGWYWTVIFYKDPAAG